MDYGTKLIEVVRKTVLQLFPEMAGGYHLLRKARVVKSTPEALHVQPLNSQGSVDTEVPPVKCAPYPAASGDIVVLGYLYGNPSEPCVVKKVGA